MILTFRDAFFWMGAAAPELAKLVLFVIVVQIVFHHFIILYLRSVNLVRACSFIACEFAQESVS